MTRPAVRAGRVTRETAAPAGSPTPGRPVPHDHRDLVRATLAHPFAVGFFVAAGALVAYWLGTIILSVSSLLTLIVVALFLAAGLNPSVEWLGHRGLSRPWAVVAVIAGVLVAVALFVVAIVPVIADQVALMIDSAPGWADALRGNTLFQQVDRRYDVLDKAEAYVTGGDFTQRLFGGVVGVGVAVLSTLANSFIVIVLMLYFLASLPRVTSAVYRLAPASRRPAVRSIGDRIVDNVGAYVSGAFIVAFCAGFSTLVFLFVVGLGRYAVALALVVALLDIIPMIGATLGAIIVSLIGLATDPTTGLICIAFYIVYQQLENYVIYPRVMSRSVDIHGSLIVIAALIGAGLLGVIGALLAIPTAAALLLVLREVVVPRLDRR